MADNVDDKEPKTAVEAGTASSEGCDFDGNSSDFESVSHVALSNPVWNDPGRPIEISWLSVEDIEPAPRRVRHANNKHIEEAKRAISRFGFRSPILVTGNRRVIDGHVRLEAARGLEIGKIPCIVVDDLTEVEIRRLALSLNRLQEWGEWDDNALRIEINELIEMSGEIEIPGFEAPEIEAIRFGGEAFDTSDSSEDEAVFNSINAQPVTQVGDLWHLRDHRLYCGSARDCDAIAELLGKQDVGVVFTDPPYNVKINGHVRSTSGGFEEFAEASGELSPEEFNEFLQSTLGNAVEALRPGGVVFVFMDWRHIPELHQVTTALNLEQLNLCVWVKTQPGMGSFYRSQHELIYVGRKPGASHSNNIQLGKFGRNRTNVWHYAGATGGVSDPFDAFEEHPTVKPVRMVMDALLDVTSQGDLVFDPFLGSGTTLLAAERTRRRCYGVEIEPAYVELTIRRWQEITGQDAIHRESGMTFSEIQEASSRGVTTSFNAHEGETF